VLPRFAATTTPGNFLEEVMIYRYFPNGDWNQCPNVGAGACVMVTA
jgi:hypothetical protein